MKVHLSSNRKIRASIKMSPSPKFILRKKEFYISMNGKSHFLVFSLLAVFCFLSPAYAITQYHMGIVVNLSGKQRMLTQKMSKEMLLIAKGIDAAANRENLKKTAALFDKTLKGLVNGDSDLKLVKTGNPKAVKQLGKVSKIWSGFKKNVAAVLAGDTSKELLEKIAVTNLTLLKNMNHAVKIFEGQAKNMGGVSNPFGLATTLNLSGKQRMLTQKMTKELLLVANGIEPEKNKINLKKTASLFERTLKGLMDGDSNLELPGTTDPVIRSQLVTIQKLWNDYKPLIENVALGESNDVPMDVLVKAANLNLPLLREMNRAVKMYEQSVKQDFQRQSRYT